MSKYHYTGFFLGKNETQKFNAICQAFREKFKSECLSEPISDPHVTVLHESDPSFTDDESLFGLTAEVEILGYGNDGKNEALQVRFLRTEDPRLIALIGSAVNRVDEDKVHITVSKSEEGKAVNSRNLKFMPVSGSDRLTLRYSGLLNKQELDSSKTVSGDLMVFIPCYIKDANKFKLLLEDEKCFVKYDVRDYCEYVYGYSYKSSGDNSIKCSVYRSNQNKIEARVFYFERTNIAILSLLYSFNEISIKDVAKLCRSKRIFKDSDIREIKENVFHNKLEDVTAKAFFFSAQNQEAFSAQNQEAQPPETIAANLFNGPNIDWSNVRNTIINNHSVRKIVANKQEYRNKICDCNDMMAKTEIDALLDKTAEHDKRANILLRLNVPLLSYPAYTEADHFYQRKLLYHFRGDGYLEKLYEPTEQDDKEIWPMDPLKVWGISSSAAVCLTCSQRGNETHLLKTYPNNFRIYYCFLYVYLLHQKYFLHYLSDNISYNSSMDELKEFDEKLTLFSNEYLYKCISDVEQYQGLYERVQEIFNIWEQLEDTQGPFEKLHDLKEKEIDAKRSRAESIINGTLFVLTFLTLVSVLCDMFQLDESLRWVINNFDLTDPSYKQTCFIIVTLLAFTIFSFFIYLIYKWIKNERSENTNKQREQIDRKAQK